MHKMGVNQVMYPLRLKVMLYVVFIFAAAILFPFLSPLLLFFASASNISRLVPVAVAVDITSIARLMVAVTVGGIVGIVGLSINALTLGKSKRKAKRKRECVLSARARFMAELTRRERQILRGALAESRLRIRQDGVLISLDDVATPSGTESIVGTSRRQGVAIRTIVEMDSESSYKMHNEIANVHKDSPFG